MTKGEPSCLVLKDVISTLPANVLSQIMECLPLRDAARASVLSKSWRYTWLSLPKLTFDAIFFRDALKDKQFDGSEFYVLVSKVLLYHVGPVSKFHLYIPKLQSTGCFIAPCLSYLSKNSVKEITLRNDYLGRITLSSYLFSCLDLEKLQLNRFKLDVPFSFKGFRNLLNLELDDALFIGNSFRRLVDCCPQLETLTLLKWSDWKGIHIHAPKMKHLTLSGKFEAIWLKSPQNLVSLSITLDEMGQNDRISRFQELIQLLSELSELEKLAVGGYTCKALTSGGIVSLLPFKYKCLKVLQLSNIDANDFSEFRFVTGIIRSCPVIQVLKISFSSLVSVGVISVEHEIDTAMSCSLDHLREVETAGVKGLSMELKLIGFLLNHSSALYQFKIKPSVTIEANLESQMTRQLMRFPRASPKAEIIYVDPKSSM
ncbi:F-box/FBD/LRR-repeat protein At1g13570-like [Silene latifolia]|uniref:F-box/FBD/LRR-repeat protein At1g13570-like n=1 Tax=Silene latifolia TaxID=37657 RepID=UPI003D771158